MKHKTSFSRRRLIQAAFASGALAAVPAAVRGELRVARQDGKPRRILFFVSDGMSQSVPALADALSRQVRDKGTHWRALMENREATMGQMETEALNSMVTDSSAASSAWGGGQRVNNGAVNMLPDGTAIRPISDWLAEREARLGLVTTATVTHATPAGFASSVASRGMEQQIAEQYFDKVGLILGGGMRFFDARRRDDGCDMCDDFGKAGYQVFRNRDELLAGGGERRLGLFSDSHVPYTLEQMHNEELIKTVPTLAEMTASALEWSLLSDAPTLIQVEGARVDHAAHGNDIAALLWDQIAYDDALGLALEFAREHPDTLVVTTSDHGNANPGLNGVGGGYSGSTRAFSRVARAKMTFPEWISGARGRAEDLNSASLREEVREVFGVGISETEADGILDSLRGNDVVEWNNQHRNTHGLLGQVIGNHNGIGWSGTSHTNDPTLISAIGPGADRFSGWVRNDAVRGIFEDLLS